MVLDLCMFSPDSKETTLLLYSLECNIMDTELVYI